MTGIGFWDFALGAPLVGAGFSFGFVVVRWTANFIAGRLDKKEARLDATMEQLLARLNAEVMRLSSECVTLREELEECRKEHAVARADIMELKAQQQGYGNAKQEAQRIIAADHAERKDPK